MDYHHYIMDYNEQLPLILLDYNHYILENNITHFLVFDILWFMSMFSSTFSKARTLHLTIPDSKHPMHRDQEIQSLIIYCWLVVYLPLWKMKVNWDDEIPNILKNKIHVPNHQPNWNVFSDSDQNLLSCRKSTEQVLRNQSSWCRLATIDTWWHR